MAVDAGAVVYEADTVVVILAWGRSPACTSQANMTAETLPFGRSSMQVELSVQIVGSLWAQSMSLYRISVALLPDVHSGYSCTSRDWTS